MHSHSQRSLQGGDKNIGELLGGEVPVRGMRRSREIDRCRSLGIGDRGT